MRGLLVFNEQSSISFCTVDREFEEHIRGKIERETPPDQFQLEDQDGLSDLRESLAMFFLPLLASFTALQSLKKPLISITGEDDLLIVFNQFDNHVFIAVNGDSTETEEMMMRKLHVLNRILGLLYGPVTQRMMPSMLQQRQIEWQRLDSLLKSYEKLYSEEQSFLVEAIEHIQFGQLNTAQNVCVSLAEDCLLSQNNGGITNMKHALLLVGTKVLAVCGRSPQLPTADTLLLILTAANRYYHTHLFPTNAPSPNVQAPEDSLGVASASQDPPTFSTDEDTLQSDLNSTRGKNVAAAAAGGGDGGIDSSSSESVGNKCTTPYQTPTNTPAPAGTREDEMVSRSFNIPARPVHDPDEHSFKTPVDEVETEKEGVSKGIGGRIKGMLTGAFGGKVGKGQDNSDNVPHDGDLSLSMSKYFEQKVFLQLNPGLFIPHILHCIEVYPQIVLVLVSETIASNLAGVICQTLANLRQVFGPGQSMSVSGRTMFDMLDDSVRRIIDGGRIEAKNLDSIKLKSKVVKVSNTWGKLKESGLLKYLEKAITDELRITKVVNQGNNLLDNLTGLFEELYFSPRQQGYDLKSVVTRLIRQSSRLNRDYGDYLAMKATINLPFPGFGATYPGMVHFTFVDRSFDELTSPSIVDEFMSSTYVEQLAKKCNKRPGDFLREKVWAMVQRAQKYLSLGYTSQTWMDTEFQYTYCMWISMLNPTLGNPHRLASAVHLKITEEEPPGVLSGNLYREISGGPESSPNQGYVNELYCILEPNIPLDIVTTRSKALALQLWQNTKQALAPFPLIN